MSKQQKANGPGGGSEEGGHMFLGEPEWVYLPSGRARCVQTGHEMPVAEQPIYPLTKKCRSALFEAALKKRTPPLNFFEQSPDAKDKIVCKLTGVVLNKKEDAVWKHMLGKKFELKLEEKEAKKKLAREHVDMAVDSSERESLQKLREAESFSGHGDKTVRENLDQATLPDEDLEDEDRSDDSDFWVPPAGDRWDYDTGDNDRWSAPDADNPSKRHSSSTTGNDDTEMVDAVENAEQDTEGSDDDEAMIRVKRTSSSGGRERKKKTKKSKAESSKQNGL